MNVRLSRGRVSASLGSVRLGSAKLVFVGLVVLAGVISGCGDSKPGVPPLSIATSSLASGQVGTSYSASLSATGGTAPYQWFLRSGSLPTGMTFTASSATIVGTPTRYAYATPLVFTVVDSSRPATTATVNLSLTIAPQPLQISTASLANGTLGSAYAAGLSVTGGTPPYTWAVVSGSLPAGLTLNAATGAISGTPSAPMNVTPITFTVTDSTSPALTKSVSLGLTIALPPLVITTATLANGQVGVAYSANLAATGGVPPYTWSMTSGSLPAGLALASGTGTISGTPTAFVYNSPVTFTVTDSTTPAMRQSATVPLTIASGITASVTPQNAGLPLGQTLKLTPTVSDSAGVSWSVSGASCSGSACGTLSATKSLTGVPVNYTAPGTAGVYTITATSVTDKTITATTTVGVTDLAGVATYHQNSARTGANTQEYALTPSNVNSSTFGKLFSCAVDGAIYAQPLWVPGLTIGGTKHNVVFVATQHEGLFAFDADASPCSTLWQVNLVDAAHGGTTGEVPVPGSYVGGGKQDIWPEIGVTGTPVIDLTTNTLYVVSKSVIVSGSGNSFYQRLHAIDLTTGNEKFSGPTTIAGTYPGSGDGGTTVKFPAHEQNQRAGLALVNGTVYIAWASHEDVLPYYGWVMGYSAGNLSQAPMVFNDSPNAGMSGIWMSGGAPAVDTAGNLYVASGNGKFDASNTTPPNNDYGDSLMQLSSSLQLNQYFTPSDQLVDDTQDRDFGSGGTVVLIDLPVNGSNPTHLVVAGGKDGNMYLLDRDKLGGYGDENAWQIIGLPNGIFMTGAFWNSTYYVATVSRSMQAYSLSSSTAKLTLLPNASTATFGFGSATPTISSMPDNSNGILWALDNRNYCTMQSHGCGPTVLHAMSASDLSTELWNSSQGTGNTAGIAVKFTVPTVANGKVYVGTRGNNIGGADSSTSTPGELDVYGLLP
jgi:Putative Ig domain